MASKNRHGYKPPFQYSKERGPNGRLLCRMCGIEVPKRRRLWCSNECVTEVFIRKGDTNIVRRELWKKDKGICQGCCLDIGTIMELEEFLKRPIRFIADKRVGEYDGPNPWDYPGNPEWYKYCRNLDSEKHKRAKIWKGFAWGRDEWLEFCKNELDIEPGHHDHYWEADHIIPVSEGGGGCGIDGYQILCIKCHKDDTKKLHRRLSGKPEISGDELQLKLLED